MKEVTTQEKSPHRVWKGTFPAWICQNKPPRHLPPKACERAPTKCCMTTLAGQASPRELAAEHKSEKKHSSQCVKGLRVACFRCGLLLPPGALEAGVSNTPSKIAIYYKMRCENPQQMQILETGSGTQMVLPCYTNPSN